MSFLGKLADQVSSQFSLGENTDTTLDTVENGQTIKYGKLGDFASKFDQSAQRKYLEEGYLRKDPFFTDSKQFEVLMQEPTATLLVKKRMFSSIGENFRTDYMDADEKLYYKAMRILFNNKCKQISALEMLSKIQRVTSVSNRIDDKIMPILFTLSDQISGVNSIGGGFGLFTESNPFAAAKDAGKFTKVMNQVRRLYAFNTTNPTTTWIKDNTNLFQNQFGGGTGVIEITNFTGFNTKVTTNINNAGSFSCDIADPYQSMLITEFDIEKAISDATNSFYNHKSYQFGLESADQIIADSKAKLSLLRNARNVGEISFRVNPETFLGRRVVAIFDRSGQEVSFKYDSSGGTGFPGLGGFLNGVTVFPESLKGGASAGIEGLDSQKVKPVRPGSSVALKADSELGLFSALITALFTKIQLEANALNTLQISNKKTNYTRKKLRFQFGGKLIIQPQDIVHFYINSRTKYDNTILSGLKDVFSGSSALTSFNNALTGLRNAAETLINPANNINFQVEKTTYVGPEFPDYLWSTIRSQFVDEQEGTHVFAGLVDRANRSNSDGKFTVNISGSDNSAYFSMGSINFKPQVDVANGTIFDPLTPFKSRFDAITSNADDDIPELLEENKMLLGTKQDKDVTLVKAQGGKNAGERVTQDNYIQDRSVDKNTGLTTKVFYAPPGLAYKWKEGIQITVQQGSVLDLNGPHMTGTPSITKDPFAGQDVMNILSLLIAGVPYNFATYWKATVGNNAIDSADSFASSLQNDLKKSNSLWGNFLPFKNLVLDEKSYVMALKTQTSILNSNNLIAEKLKRIDKLSDDMALSNIYDISSPLSEQDQKGKMKAVKIKQEFDKLNAEAQSLINQVKQQNKDYFKMVGDEVSFDINSFIDSSKISKAADNDQTRRLIRRQMNYLTKRMSYNVRANDDKNLLIVDDFYDKDYDIAAYEQAFENGINQLSSDFTTVKQKIEQTAQLLNLEVFCDTQGHVRIRPPQYNRMPSSVFYRMMYLKKHANIQVFPQFLDDLFSTQLKTLRERLEIVEDYIRLDCAALGIYLDPLAEAFVGQGDVTNGAMPNGSAFGFISDDNGIVANLATIMEQANADLQGDSEGQDFQSIKDQALSTRDVFSPSQRFQAVLGIYGSQSNFNAFGIDIGTDALYSSTRVADIISRLETKTGKKIPVESFLKSKTVQGDTEAVFARATTVDSFKVTKDISDKLLERQKVLKLLYSAIKNSTELKSLDVPGTNVDTSLLMPGNGSNTHIPEVFEHMIEDESYDDYGPGSGARFIIKNAQIKSSNFQEKAPAFTMVEVQGSLDPLLENGFEPVPGLSGFFPGKGNGAVTAIATDFDMWRNYGLIPAQPVRVSFLKDPNSQLGPYASMLLSIARKNILQGTVTIAGNEHQQPGEVVFMEDSGLLYYTNSIEHSFRQGQSFQTTLDLSYGHSPGEYIPTTVDIIGKLIYNNRDVASYEIQRQTTSASEISMGILQRDRNQALSGAFNITATEMSDPQNSLRAANTKIINDILYQAAYIINSKATNGLKSIANLQLRVYYDDDNLVDKQLDAFVKEAKIIFARGTVGPLAATQKPTTAIDFDNIKIEYINMSDTNEKRGPSQKAIDGAKNMTDLYPSGTGGMKDKIRSCLYKYIVDCYITFNTSVNA